MLVSSTVWYNKRCALFFVHLQYTLIQKICETKKDFVCAVIDISKGEKCVVIYKVKTKVLYIETQMNLFIRKLRRLVSLPLMSARQSMSVFVPCPISEMAQMASGHSSVPLLQQFNTLK